MVNNKKSSSEKKKALKAQKNLNAENLDRLKRLSDALASLDDKGTLPINNNVGNNSNDDIERIIGLSLGHWRDLDDETKYAYKMLNDGAELIKATSTKYTLVGKINVDDGSKFSEDLRQGCELISTAALLVHQPSIGCSRSLRKYVKQHARGLVTSVMNLIESFESFIALEKNVGAQNTGVVWSRCDEILTKLPKGNRAAMRREMFTWVGDCNESMQEFQEIVDLGPTNTNASTGEKEASDSSTWDDFCDNIGTGEQYTDREIDIAKSCVKVMKCSRGILNLMIKACECAGNHASSLIEEEENKVQSKAIYQWISNGHEMARIVGENVTEIGMCLYPPLNLTLSDVESGASNIEGKWIQTELGLQILRQSAAIKAVASYVHDHIASVNEHESISIQMSDEVLEMATVLLAAVDARKEETRSAISTAIDS